MSVTSVNAAPARDARRNLPSTSSFDGSIATFKRTVTVLAMVHTFADDFTHQVATSRPDPIGRMILWPPRLPFLCESGMARRSRHTLRS